MSASSLFKHPVNVVAATIRALGHIMVRHDASFDSVWNMPNLDNEIHAELCDLLCDPNYISFIITNGLARDISVTGDLTFLPAHIQGLVLVCVGRSYDNVSHSTELKDLFDVDFEKALGIMNHSVDDGTIRHLDKITAGRLVSLEGLTLDD